MREFRVRLERNDPVAAALVRAQLERLGCAARDIAESEQGGCRSVCLFTRSLPQAQRMRDRLRALGIRGIRVGIRSLADSDWKTRWKRYFRPFDITPEIRVIPAWRSRVPSTCARGRVVIDTSVAFGTGLHATTRLMARSIRACRGRFRSFLDIGTGSGILALVAGQYGAGEILAIDCDPGAVRTAGENFRRNGSRARVQTADFSLWLPEHPFDFVAANLLSLDLVRMRARLRRAVKTGGFLAVSGVFEDNIRSFRKKFYGRPFRLVHEWRLAGWYGALVERIA